jgi:hypothetical protein
MKYILLAVFVLWLITKSAGDVAGGLFKTTK